VAIHFKRKCNITNNNKLVKIIKLKQGNNQFSENKKGDVIQLFSHRGNQLTLLLQVETVGTLEMVLMNTMRSLLS
jgi:hypothetical protein